MFKITYLKNQFGKKIISGPEYCFQKLLLVTDLKNPLTNGIHIRLPLIIRLILDINLSKSAYSLSSIRYFKSWLHFNSHGI